MILCGTAMAGLAADKEEWTPLFDGKSTKGWTPRAKVESFQAVDGELHLFSKVNVWVVSDIKMGDFVVETEVMIPQDYKGFNSGLGFRLIGEKGKPRGYQCEIDRGKPAGVYGIGMGGWLYPKGPTAAQYSERAKGLFKPFSRGSQGAAHPHMAEWQAHRRGGAQAIPQGPLWHSASRQGWHGEVPQPARAGTEVANEARATEVRLCSAGIPRHRRRHSGHVSTAT